jgi:hypothetical protein
MPVSLWRRLETDFDCPVGNVTYRVTLIALGSNINCLCGVDTEKGFGRPSGVFSANAKLTSPAGRLNAVLKSANAISDDCFPVVGGGWATAVIPNAIAKSRMDSARAANARSAMLLPPQTFRKEPCRSFGGGISQCGEHDLRSPPHQRYQNTVSKERTCFRSSCIRADSERRFRRRPRE